VVVELSLLCVFVSDVYSFDLTLEEDKHNYGGEETTYCLKERDGKIDRER
jgi:hypothetical protein